MYKIFISEEKEKNLIKVIDDFKELAERKNGIFWGYQNKKINLKECSSYTSKHSYYKEFRNNKDLVARWLKILEINTCLYCNLAFVNSNSKVEVSIDHFYSKDKFPSISCNIFNFIPTCSVCNSQYKGEKTLPYCYYPYIFESDQEIQDNHLVDNIKFSQKINSVKDIQVTYYNDPDKIAIDCHSEMQEEYNKVLAIHDRYNNIAIKREALELIQKIMMFENENYYEYLKIFTSGMDVSQIKTIIFGTSFEDKSDYLNRPLSKLRRDLIKQRAPWLLK